MGKTCFSFLFMLALALVANTPASAQSAKRGLALAQQNCAACHAIGRKGASTMRKAVPLRNLAARYPLEQLEEAFAEGVMVTHKGQAMPAFEMNPTQIADLLAYIRSVTVKRR